MSYTWTAVAPRDPSAIMNCFGHSCLRQSFLQEIISVLKGNVCPGLQPAMAIVLHRPAGHRAQDFSHPVQDIVCALLSGQSVCTVTCTVEVHIHRLEQAFISHGTAIQDPIITITKRFASSGDWPWKGAFDSGAAKDKEGMVVETTARLEMIHITSMFGGV